MPLKDLAAQNHYMREQYASPANRERPRKRTRTRRRTALASARNRARRARKESRIALDPGFKAWRRAHLLYCKAPGECCSTCHSNPRNRMEVFDLPDDVHASLGREKSKEGSGPRSAIP